MKLFVLVAISFLGANSALGVLTCDFNAPIYNPDHEATLRLTADVVSNSLIRNIRLVDTTPVEGPAVTIDQERTLRGRPLARGNPQTVANFLQYKFRASHHDWNDATITVYLRKNIHTSTAAFTGKFYYRDDAGEGFFYGDVACRQ